MISAIPVQCSTNWAMKPRSRSSVSSIYTRYMKRITWFVYDKDHMSALWIKNTSESDLRSCEAALAVAKKAQKKKMMLQRDLNPWSPRYRCDALPTELWSLVGSRSCVSSIYTRYMKRMTWCLYDKDHMSALRIKNTSEVVKQLKPLQRKPWKSEALTGFEPMTSVIPLQCSTNSAMKPRLEAGQERDQDLRGIKQ